MPLGPVRRIDFDIDPGAIRATRFLHKGVTFETASLSDTKMWAINRIIITLGLHHTVSPFLTFARPYAQCIALPCEETSNRLHA